MRQLKVFGLFDIGAQNLNCAPLGLTRLPYAVLLNRNWVENSNHSKTCGQCWRTRAFAFLCPLGNCVSRRDTDPCGVLYRSPTLQRLVSATATDTYQQAGFVTETFLSNSAEKPLNPGARFFSGATN